MTTVSLLEGEQIGYLINNHLFLYAVAITHLRRLGRYSKVNAIVSGVNDKAAAHGSIKDYHSQMTKARWEKEHGPFHEAELKVFAGGENPMQKPAPHEKLFPGQPEPIKHHMSELHKHFHPETKEVDVFHLVRFPSTLEVIRCLTFPFLLCRLQCTTKT
jgi:hypothetical protein